MDNVNIRKIGETTPSTDSINKNIGKSTGLLHNLTKDPDILAPKMDDFKHYHDDLVYDKERVKKLQEDALNKKYYRAKERLAAKGEDNGDNRIEKIVEEENAEEQLVSELLESTLSDGIIREGWINYIGKNKESFKVRELASVEKADDYRNRIDAPFCFEFPDASGETEKIFVGFDATLSTKPDIINDKLTRSTNVSKERKQKKNLPFGFSTLRYTYDPSNGERMISDEVIRYTICADKKLFETMRKVNDSIDPLPEKATSPEYQETRFKVLSEIYEQNKFFKAMNKDNQKALKKINKLNRSIWVGINNSISHLVSGTSFFADLLPNLKELKDLGQQIKALPQNSQKWLELQSLSDRKRWELYEEVSRRYRSGEVGTGDNSYGVLVHAARDFTNAATKTNLLDKYKAPQPRNVPFDTGGNIFEMEEWYGKTDENGKAYRKSN